MCIVHPSWVTASVSRGVLIDPRRFGCSQASLSTVAPNPRLLSLSRLWGVFSASRGTSLANLIASLREKPRLDPVFVSTSSASLPPHDLPTPPLPRFSESLSDYVRPIFLAAGSTKAELVVEKERTNLSSSSPPPSPLQIITRAQNCLSMMKRAYLAAKNGAYDDDRDGGDEDINKISQDITPEIIGFSPEPRTAPSGFSIVIPPSYLLLASATFGQGDNFHRMDKKAAFLRPLDSSLALAAATLSTAFRAYILRSREGGFSSSIDTPIRVVISPSKMHPTEISRLSTLTTQLHKQLSTSLPGIGIDVEFMEEFDVKVCTHLITRNGQPSEKIVQASRAGAYIVNNHWLVESLLAGYLLNESFFEPRMV